MGRGLCVSNLAVICRHPADRRPAIYSDETLIVARDWGCGAAQAADRRPARASGAAAAALLGAGGLRGMNPLHVQLLLMNRDFNAEDYEALFLSL